MMDRAYLGQDLDLGFVSDDRGRVFAGPASSADLKPVLRQKVTPRGYDLGLVRGRANLVQALIMRVLTERGELAALGHPDYGSRHHQLIGEPNTVSNRNLVKLYILECLQQEPRVERVVAIDVTPGNGRENRDKADVALTVKMRDDPVPLSFVIPFSFGGPA
jgi:hypothetical protein